MKPPVRKYKKSERMKEKERMREAIRERERTERLANKALKIKSKDKKLSGKLMVSVNVNEGEVAVP